LSITEVIYLGMKIRANRERNTVKVEVFTSPTCPHCPSAIRIAREVAREFQGQVRVIEVSTATPSGSRRARKYGIMSVPTVIVTGPGSVESLGHRGTPSRKTLKKLIKIALGDEYDEKKEGFLSRLLKSMGIG